MAVWKLLYDSKWLSLWGFDNGEVGRVGGVVRCLLQTDFFYVHLLFIPWN